MFEVKDTTNPNYKSLYLGERLDGYWEIYQVKTGPRAAAAWRLMFDKRDIFECRLSYFDIVTDLAGRPGVTVPNEVNEVLALYVTVHYCGCLTLKRPEQPLCENCKRQEHEPLEACTCQSCVNFFEEMRLKVE